MESTDLTGLDMNEVEHPDAPEVETPKIVVGTIKLPAKWLTEDES
jgi:hypothetical protein